MGNKGSTTANNSRNNGGRRSLVGSPIDSGGKIDYQRSISLTNARARQQMILDTYSSPLLSTGSILTTASIATTTIPTVATEPEPDEKINDEDQRPSNVYSE